MTHANLAGSFGTACVSRDRIGVAGRRYVIRAAGTLARRRTHGDLRTSSRRRTTSRRQRSPTLATCDRAAHPRRPLRLCRRARLVQVRPTSSSKGDSLSLIAKREYGDANKWRAIYEANKQLIKDPDLIYPGQELKIPGA